MFPLSGQWGKTGMKAIATLAAAAVTIMLAGCDRLAPAGGRASNDRAEARAPRDRGAPAAKAGTRADGGANGGGVMPAQPGLGGRPVPGTVQAASTLAPAVDRAFLIGRWTNSGDCREAGAFAADGQYTNAAGVAARWALDGDRLEMVFAGAAPRTLRVAALDQNTLTVTNPDGSLGRSTRC